MSEREAVEQFRQALAASGLSTSDKIEPTEGAVPSRFHVDGDKPKTRNGWYVLFTDGLPAGEFGSFKTGITQSWVMHREGRPPNAEERREAEERIAKHAKLRDDAERERHGIAAKRANLMLEEADRATDDHPYLVRKGVRAHGLKIGRWTKESVDEYGEVEVWLDVPNALLVPIRDSKGRIINVQAIFPALHRKLGRDKDFQPNGKKKSGFHIIGAPTPGQPIVICEGYATGASIHEATSYCAVVAFDAGNLEPVARAMRELLPDSRFLIAADNDQWTTEPMENPGVHFANRAGKAINCRVVVPHFSDVTSQPTDFNDLHQLEGAHAVVAQIIRLESPVAVIDATAPDSPCVVTEAPLDVDRFDLPDQGARGSVLGTHGNLAEICRRLGVIVRYNQVTKDQEIIIPGQKFSMDNREIASFAWLENQCILFRMPTGTMRNGLTYMADKNQFSPVVTWVTSRPWDGTSRIRELFDTITPETKFDDEKGKANKLAMRDMLIRKWMVSAIAAAFSPEGVAAQGMLVLQGAQGMGKTRWLKSLTPESLGLSKDGMLLNPSDKDSVKQALGFWLVELGELDATFRKSDIAALKGFITKDKDILRLPYAPKENHFARRTVFFGSVNPKQFLHDPTGNRRFWTIEAVAVNANHGIDMQQVWAEILELWRGGEAHYLTGDENNAVNQVNEDFQVVDPIEERLQTGLDWDCDIKHWLWKTSTDILFSVGIERPTQSEAIRCSMFVRKDPKFQVKKNRGKALLLSPPPVQRHVSGGSHF